ncbi:hypothetical protein [Metapseudomonas furukawaii]|jgi:hypothetical protein|uniref:hypothetical protein n=1 Tax=Metapseudomonas furukawaii TaxID=1149133 RepID=UPI0009D92276|nr:hypothetical protein [Pseudomonas furukawaii]
MNYHEIEALKEVYLEDSYVLEIEETIDKLIFRLEAVLTEKNPFFTPPNPEEQYCYKIATLEFHGAHFIRWIKKSKNINTDSAKETDLGNIDTFTIENRLCTLSGDWGVVEVDCENIYFRPN